MNTLAFCPMFFACLCVTVSFFVAEANACTCSLDPAPPCRAFASSDVIFDAQILRVDKVKPDSNGYFRRRALVKVGNLYTGSLGIRVYVYTGVNDADCGYRF